jgi:hypothetical protein
MKTMITTTTKNLILATALASGMAMSASNTLADSAATIFGLSSGTAVTYDNASGSYPVITAILSQPGTLDGYTYTSWSFLAQDASGSLDMYGALPGSSSYVPAVGDAISVSGTYSPYHQIPEVGTMTSISLMSSGNPVSAPPVYTIPDMTASTTIPQALAGTLLALNHVSLYTDSAATIPVSGDFPTHANLALYAKDGSGNIMEIYVWASSYSVDGALGGTPIPTGPVNIVGFLSQSGTYPVEMTPFSITSVPEPTALAVFGLGGCLLLAPAVRRRRAVRG